jgi:hypothetical protein
VALIGFLTAQVGFPMTVRPATVGGSVRPCGCRVTDDSEKCCCSAAPTQVAPCCQPQKVEAAVDDGLGGECPRCRAKAKPTPAEAASESGPRVTWVVASLLQHCHGVQTNWIALGAVLPPAPDVRVAVDALASERVPLMTFAALLSPAAPTEPPPRTPSV